MSVQRILSIFSLILGGVVLAGCASTPPPSQEPIAVAPIDLNEREEITIDRLYILTDVSRSMAEGPIAEAKALTQSFVAGLPEDDATYEVSAISFGGSERSVRRIGSFDRDELEAAAAGIQPLGGRGGGGGSSQIDLVLDEVATEIAGKSGSTSIILITDGDADNSTTAMNSAKRLVSNASGPVCIHAIQVGDSADGRALVSNMSKLTDCGSVRAVEEIQTASHVSDLSRTALAVQMSALPAVAAAPPCQSTVQLHGVRFGFDDATLTPDSVEVIDRAAEQLNSCKELDIVIGGHSDTTGPKGYNIQLSMRRAEAVRQQLIEEGVDESRLTSKGYGPENPLGSNDTRDGRAQNRRVDLTPVE